MAANTDSINAARELTQGEYKYGFVTEVEEDRAPKGLDENVVRFISAKKNEPEWMLEWRLRAFRAWCERFLPAGDPTWANVRYPKIDYQDSYYYAAPKSQEDRPRSLDEVDPELLAMYDKLGIPLHDRAAHAARSSFPAPV